MLAPRDLDAYSGSSPLVANGLPNFIIVEVTDRAIQEARDRVRASIRNAGLQYPQRRLTVRPRRRGEV
jgi:Subunit ChlI of Mg-chelatase